MNRFVIYGAGGFGRELIFAAEQYASRPLLFGGNPRPLAFADEHMVGSVLGVPIVRPHELTDEDEAVIAIADGKTRRHIAESMKCRSAKLFAATAIVGPDTEVGEGAILCDFTMITASAKIGLHFHANIYSYVAHDCRIGNYVTFAPRVCCNGNVRIGDGAYIGTGAVLKQGTPDRPLMIGAGSVIGMGAVVTKDVPPGETVIGNPARSMERRPVPAFA